jgi:hypothetical protein
VQIPLEGDIFIDGKNTADLNLDALRRSMTIIPRAHPLFFVGGYQTSAEPLIFSSLFYFPQRTRLSTPGPFEATSIPTENSRMLFLSER